MKCSKCGEECKENQAFCLKCGNPIQVVPDFNLIEAELASNIGELMDEMAEKPVKEKTEDDEMQIKDMDISNMELKLVDISKKPYVETADGKTKVIGDISRLINESHTENTEHASISPEKEKPKKTEIEEKNGKTQGAGKKKIVIVSVVLVLILAAAVTIFIIAAKSVEKGATPYDDYITSAKNAYESSDTKKALEEAYNALDKADTDERKLEVRKLIYDIHKKMGESGEKYCENLEKLVELKNADEMYYVSLAKYYDENKQYRNLTNLLTVIDDGKLDEALAQYIVKEPEADMESGDYKEYIAVELSAEEGCSIYYTTDSRHPSNYGELYNEPIQITSEGEFVIKAISVNEKGVESKVATYIYDIELSGSGAPKVTPSGGVYSEHTTIKVEVPEGGKAYYTWDGSEPTEESSLYDDEDGIEMARGINVLKVVIIDKYDIKSEITQESYNLQIERTLTLNEAVTLIQERADRDLKEEMTASVSYDSTKIIDNEEYYIIVATVSGADGDKKEVTVYAVNTFDRSISTVVEKDGELAVEKEEE